MKFPTVFLFMLSLFSPAKVNLFLRILSKRNDGYHNLSSVFQAVSLGDVLNVSLHHKDELTCDNPSLPVDGSNLVLKAVQLFRNKTGLKLYFKVQLNKKIPFQAGLGGGSSNAATMLWACNQLAKTFIPSAILQQWSGEIGSDVPFFFSLGTAHCTGRGECVHDLPFLGDQSLFILKPQGGLSTPEVFRRLSVNHPVCEQVNRTDVETFLTGSFSYFNDLEKAAFEINPELLKLKLLLLEQGFKHVVMSGSGSSFFCLGEAALPKLSNVTIFSTRFINRSASNWYKVS
ncbi:MAG: 4-(cytidine 5'-diphospho)-2-C-methyl-D-erythritol kinase [Parachlamydiaceae bacterium]